MKNDLVRALIKSFNEATDAIPCWDKYVETGKVGWGKTAGQGFGCASGSRSQQTMSPWFCGEGWGPPGWWVWGGCKLRVDIALGFMLWLLCLIFASSYSLAVRCRRSATSHPNTFWLRRPSWRARLSRFSWSLSKQQP